MTISLLCLIYLFDWDEELNDEFTSNNVLREHPITIYPKLFRLIIKILKLYKTY